MSKQSVKRLLATSILAAAATLGISSTASAAESGTVSAVEYHVNGTLLIQVAGENYFAITNPSPGCKSPVNYATTMEQQKMFMSLAQAALLSGKKVLVYYGTCEGTKYIVTLDLWA